MRKLRETGQASERNPDGILPRTKEESSIMLLQQTGGITKTSHHSTLQGSWTTSRRGSYGSISKDGVMQEKSSYPVEEITMEGGMALFDLKGYEISGIWQGS